MFKKGCPSVRDLTSICYFWECERFRHTKMRSIISELVIVIFFSNSSRLPCKIHCTAIFALWISKFSRLGDETPHTLLYCRLCLQLNSFSCSTMTKERDWRRRACGMRAAAPRYPINSGNSCEGITGNWLSSRSR